MNIKYAVWTLVFFMCIAITDGYSGGGKDYTHTRTYSTSRTTPVQNQNDDEAISALEKRVTILENSPSQGNTNVVSTGSTSTGSVNTGRTETSQLSTTSSSSQNREPVNSEFINRYAQRVNLQTVDYYLSQTIKLTATQPSENIRVSGGNIIEESHLNKFEINISGEEKGRLNSPLNINSNEIIVVFRGNINVKFGKNSSDNFGMISASASGQNGDITFNNEGATPHLVITVNRENSEYNGTPQNMPNTAFREPSYSNYATSGIGGSKYLNILDDDGSLVREASSNREAIISYIRSKNRNSGGIERVTSIIHHYIEEARIEGINPYFAIAQMCYATDYLRNNNLMGKHNYANLLGSSFQDLETGIRAHIQHLVGYATTRQPRPNVDPRWDRLENFRGQIQTLDGLSRKWTPNNAQRYTSRVTEIIDELRNAASLYRGGI